MPSSRLYLVRREVESFIGPLSAQDFGRNLSRMTIGLQDEVSGNCGPWVFIQDVTAVKKHYPELLGFVKDALASGWSGDVAPGLRNETTLKGAAPLPPKGPDRRMLFAAAFFGLATLAAIVAWILAGQSELSSRIVGNAPIAVEEASRLLRERRDNEFMGYLEPGLRGLVDRSIRERDQFTTWIPFLRAYAFLGTGEIEGLAGKKLRGEAGMGAPADCSLRAWKKRWRDAAPVIQEFAAGRNLPADHWARVLAWDPHWVARRTQSGWQRPANFHEGCMWQAFRALEQVIAEASPVKSGGVLNSALARLKYQMGVVAGNASAAGDQAVDVFGLWTCVDSARDRPGIDVCLGKPWQDLMHSDYNREKFYWGLLRLAVKARQTGESKSWSLLRNDLQAFMNGRDSSDSFTRLEYADELRFVGFETSGGFPQALDPAKPAPSPVKSLVGDAQVDMAH